MITSFTVVIDQDIENDKWFCWLTKHDVMGNPTDEYRTRLFDKRRAAIDRMVTLCRASSELGDEAVKAVRSEARRDE